MEPSTNSNEVHFSRTELRADEDVLSDGARAALEDVGTAVGLICALVLLMAHFARAGRLFPASGMSESREARELERRAQEALAGERHV